jgi:amino acid adenylation domain-containing protein
MSERVANLPPEQQAIRDRCFHPSETFVEFPKEVVETSIPERFEKTARMYPERLAVKDKARSLTYDELNKAANRIAHAILEKRGQRSEPIALFFEHGIEAIAAIFGVLKAGKFYLALDVSFPQERNSVILADSQAAMVVTDNRNLDLARKLTKDARALINIDRISDDLSSDNVGLTVSAIDLAHLLYTSGSTGGPKGVVHSHRGELYYLTELANRLRICPQDRLSLLHSVSFGSAEFNLYTSLLTGAAILPFDLKSEGVHRLASWLRDEQITICHLPGAVFRQLGDLLIGQDNLPNLRLIRLSGAPVTRRDFELYKEKFLAGTLLHITMGSSEAHVACSFLANRRFSFPKAGTPVGYPYQCRKILLLDENGHEVEPGEAGEIAIKGPGLAPHYWNRPDLTKAKFLPDPNGGDDRIYLTGDLGRKLSDDFLIHLGRKDFMVKIRGYRVELGEIERALLEHPQVREVGVVASDRTPGEKYLIAYVVARYAPAPTINELYNFLKKMLPDYMMPSAFIFLESLPLTNGKLDRTALPLPDHKRPNLEQPYTLPQGEVETRLVQIWEEVLTVRPIGIYDNFVELGGYSLLGAKLIAQIQRDFQIDVPLRLLAEYPTVAQLAVRIKALQDRLLLQKENQNLTYLVKLTSEPGLTRVFCFSHAGNFRGDLLRFAQLNRLIGSEYSFYGIQARGSDGLSRPHGSVEEMAAAYIEEIQTIQPQGPYFLIGECGAGPIAYETAQQLRVRGEKVALFALLDSRVYQSSARRYFWRRYFWYRYVPCFPWICYQIYRVSQSWAWNYFKERTAHHLAEVQCLGYSQGVRYVFVKAGKIKGLVSPAPSGAITKPPKEAKVIEHHLNKDTRELEEQTAKAYPLYPLYRYPRLRYKHRSYDGKITVLANEGWYEADPTMGWVEVARGGLDVHKIPGDHNTYITKNIRLVADRLRECLEKAKREAEQGNKNGHQEL